MKAKEYLQRLKKLDIKINQKIKELEDLKVTARSVKSIDYSKERVQSSPSTEAPFVKTVEKINILENEINAKIDEFVDEKDKIINQIQGLDDSMYINILYKHYVEFMTFEKIAVDLNYSIRNIYVIHEKALQNFEQVYFQK